MLKLLRFRFGIRTTKKAHLSSTMAMKSGLRHFTRELPYFRQSLSLIATEISLIVCLCPLPIFLLGSLLFNY